MIKGYRVHLLSGNSKVDKNNQGLGYCYTFGYVSNSISDVTCKKCMNKLQEESEKNEKRKLTKRI